MRRVVSAELGLPAGSTIEWQLFQDEHSGRIAAWKRSTSTIDFATTRVRTLR
jgi:hypothetical protein